jgi:hypothetical protein
MDTATEKRYWMSPAPAKCDTCQGKIEKTFYDAATSYGAWGCLCPTCFHLGPGLGQLGTGKGQEYKKQKDGRWLKTGG